MFIGGQSNRRRRRPQERPADFEYPAAPLFEDAVGFRRDHQRGVGPRGEIAELALGSDLRQQREVFHRRVPHRAALGA